MWYWIFRVIFIVILRLFFKLRVEGLDNLPSKSNFIIVSNHTSFLDSICFVAVLPQKIHCVSSQWLYSIGWLNWFLKKMETIPTGNSSGKAIELLLANRNVGLFPEGGCSPTGELRDFKTGISLLAVKTGRPIVPCAILGTYQILPVSSMLPKLFREIKIKIGSPLYFMKEFNENIDDVYLQEGNLKVRESIKELIYE